MSLCGSGGADGSLREEEEEGRWLGRTSAGGGGVSTRGAGVERGTGRESRLEELWVLGLSEDAERTRESRGLLREARISFTLALASSMDFVWESVFR